MNGLLAAPFAELFELDLALNLLLIFAGIIILPLADGTTKSD